MLLEKFMGALRHGRRWGGRRISRQIHYFHGMELSAEME